MIAHQGAGEAFAGTPMHDQSARSTSALTVICLIVLCITLSLGLWPFHAPRNEVAWLKDGNGLSVGRNGTIISSDALTPADSRDETSCSLEIWVQPQRILESATILAFYTRENPYHLSLHQSLTDLSIESTNPNGEYVGNRTKLLVPGVFRHASLVFITITSGRHGTGVYVDGVLIRAAPQFRIPTSYITGRVLLADSALQSDSWEGQVRGLAIYDTELPAGQVSRHQRTWTKDGHPEVAEGEQPLALYLLDEHSGDVVHSNVKSGVRLIIPEKYMVVDKLFMEPFLREFNMSSGYWLGVLKNIVGFLPLGFCFYPYLSARQGRSAMLLTILAGLIASLTIEILQGFLPTRDSGMTDILTNTLGTWIGVLLYRGIYTRLGERFPWLPFTAFGY